MLGYLKRALDAVFNFLQGIVVIMAVMVMIYLFVMSPQEISGQSMFPNFHNGEYILTNKVIYRLQEPQRGDVVVFKSPNNKDIDYIKRVIALPGETVALAGSTFYINGEPLKEHYIDPSVHTFAGSYLKEGQQIVVPPGRYFLVGDNRPHSLDSREFGPIAKHDLIGHAFLRYWPVNHMGLIERQHFVLAR